MSDHEPIPSLAEAMAEIRRLRARVAELARLEERFAELESIAHRLLPRCAELEAAAAMVHGTLEKATTLGPVVITHNLPPNAPPHDE